MELRHNFLLETLKLQRSQLWNFKSKKYLLNLRLSLSELSVIARFCHKRIECGVKNKKSLFESKILVFMHEQLFRCFYSGKHQLPPEYLPTVAVTNQNKKENFSFHAIDDI